MRHIVIVEDKNEDVQLLKSYVERFSKEEKELCKVSLFKNGIEFISNYSAVTDVIFLDIELPHMNGINTAKALREIDLKVAIIFVSNMAQYAVEGYDVQALDFMVKPFGYMNFAVKLKKALRFSDSNKENEIIIVKEDTVVKIPVSKIFFIEKDKNYIIYNTANGTFKERGTIKQIEEKMQGYGFSKCISGCLVNMKHVFKTTKNAVFVHEKELPISRQQHKKFMDELFNFYYKKAEV